MSTGSGPERSGRELHDFLIPHPVTHLALARLDDTRAVRADKAGLAAGGAERGLDADHVLLRDT